MTTSTARTAVQELPLHALHLSNGGRMVHFAGYDMPIQYGAGILREHLHTRAAAGLFDVSHMGQIVLHPHSGDILDAARALEGLVPADIITLPSGRQRYTFFTTESGGIRDDLMVANLGDCLFWSSMRPVRLRTRLTFVSTYPRPAASHHCPSVPYWHCKDHRPVLP